MEITRDGMPVGSLIGAIKEAVTQAGVSSAPQGRGLRVSSVEVTLQAVASRSGGGTLTFCVPFLGMTLGAGGKVSRKGTHTIVMTLVPQQTTAVAARAMSADKVRDMLVNAITAIRDTMASAREGGDPWALSTAAVDISFALTETGDVSLGVDGGLDREVTNTLRLNLANAGGG